MPSPNVLRAAKNIRRPGEPNILGVPRQLIVPTIHMGEVVGVDVGRNVLGYQFNDPELTSLATGVGWLQAYTRDDPPTVGDSIRALYFGRQLMVIGKQVVPDGVVIL